MSVYLLIPPNLVNNLLFHLILLNEPSSYPKKCVKKGNMRYFAPAHVRRISKQFKSSLCTINPSKQVLSHPFSGRSLAFWPNRIAGSSSSTGYRSVLNFAQQTLHRLFEGFNNCISVSPVHRNRGTQDIICVQGIRGAGKRRGRWAQFFLPECLGFAVDAWKPYFQTKISMEESHDDFKSLFL